MSATKTKPDKRWLEAKTKHPCRLCGALRPADEMVYSAWTRTRYCDPRHWAACERKANRNRRERGTA